MSESVPYWRHPQDGSESERMWLRGVEAGRTAMLDEVTRLRAELSKLRDALEFYADKFTWRSNSGKVGIQPINISVERGDDVEIIDGQWTPGAKAREALK